MRIGYSYWGFLGDYKYENGKEVSTPDGNAAYSWALIHELIRQGHDVVQMQKDRDVEGWKLYGLDNFASFSQKKRGAAYVGMHKTGGHGHPELDVLLVEWRFPIVGRNAGIDPRDTAYQPDLDRQRSILEHYSSLGIPIILWDLDHKLTCQDEREWSPAAVFETSAEPRAQHIVRTRVEPPTLVDDLLQHPTLPVDSKRKLVYIGSRYERDDIIDRFVRPISDIYPGEVEFWGKWLDADKLWPNISYRDRITMKDFRKAYGTAVACPLLAKDEYMKRGFITPRPAEAILFGTIPIGFTGHKNIEQYSTFTIDGLVPAKHQLELLADLTEEERHITREEAAHKIHFTDAKHFVKKIEDVVG